jgi:hypothetical protein
VDQRGKWHASWEPSQYNEALTFGKLLQEDDHLVEIIETKQDMNPNQEVLSRSGIWPEIAAELGTDRKVKQCRDRWQLYLRPGIKKGNWSTNEEELIRDMYATFGPR